MTLKFTPVTLDDPAVLADYHDVAERATQHDCPEFPLQPPHSFARNLANPWPGRDQHSFVAYHEDQPVGVVDLEVPTRENLSNLWVDMEVPSELRRQGVGRQMHDFVVEFARAHNRTILQAETLWSIPQIAARNEDGARFAEAVGYKASNDEAIRRLTIADIDQSKLDAMLKETPGYRVVMWRDSTPAEYAVDIAYLDSRLISDAPTGDLQLEAPQADVTHLKEIDDCLDRRQRSRYHTGAVHEASNRLVAWTTISTDADIPWHAWQQITIVDPDHRGHRLGALVKVENLRQFLAAEPNVEVIDTGNAVSNSYMIAINENMGFRPLRGLQAWQLSLTTM